MCRRYVLGDWISFQVQCLNSSGVPTAPTAAPQLSIYSNAGTEIVADQKMPPSQKGVRTGLFLFEQFLNSSFAAGKYHGIAVYAISGSTFHEQFIFEIVAGGNNKGAYLAIHPYRTPHADYIVGLTDGGTLEERKNPRV